MKTKRHAPQSGEKATRANVRGSDSPRRGRTAPTREDRPVKSGRSGPRTSPVTRPVGAPGRAKSATQAQARAKARKAKAPKVVRPKLIERVALRLSAIDLRPRTIAAKVPFVVLIIGSLAVGLGLTLWLSTDAAERSYQLSHARQHARLLEQQKESLERDVREAQSAPALSEAARKLGMIPSRDTAHLVQDPAGTWVVVGNPKPADGAPPPPLNAKLPDPTPPAPPVPPAPPLEVSVRLGQNPADAQPPFRPGPHVLVRGPDGSTTLGTVQLPGQLTQPGVPSIQVPLQAGSPGLSVPAQSTPALPGQAAVPAQLPTPGQAAVPGLSLVPAQQPVAGQTDLPFQIHAPIPLQPTAPLPAAGTQIPGAFPAAPMTPVAPR